MNTTQQLRDIEKRAALEQVLQSATFTRASQVRNFLLLHLRMEIAGPGGGAARVT